MDNSKLQVLTIYFEKINSTLSFSVQHMNENIFGRDLKLNKWINTGADTECTSQRKGTDTTICTSNVV